jgi:hypothetical protein
LLAVNEHFIAEGFFRRHRESLVIDKANLNPSRYPNVR